MKTFEQSFADIERLTALENKPLLAFYAKLGEEFGEAGLACNIMEGFITHKELDEPLSGEIADVCQVAISMLIKTTPGMSNKNRVKLFLSELERKNNKWAGINKPKPAPILPPTTLWKIEDNTIEGRVKRIIAEQLGLELKEVLDVSSFTEDLGADSLDEMELLMALEDEFDIEIPDADAKSVVAVYQVVNYIKHRFGEAPTHVPNEETIEAMAEADDMMEERLDINQFRFDAPPKPTVNTFDPAADYTERTGRYLSLDERMNERLLFNTRNQTK
jgi:acyl carrier protein